MVYLFTFYECVCVCVCVCVLASVIQSANRIISASYCIFICCLSDSYHIFAHYFIKGKIFAKISPLNIKCVLLFSVLYLSETFLIMRTIQGDIIINLDGSPRKLPLAFCRILNKFEFSRWIVEKSSNTFHKNWFSGRLVVPCRQTWRS